MTITSNPATITVSSGRKLLYNDGLFISAEEIGIIKTQLNRDPWLTSFHLLESAAVNALGATEEYYPRQKYDCVQSCVDNSKCETGHTCSRGTCQVSPKYCDDYMKGQRIRDRIRTLGLYYALTGNEAYANKVFSWINKLLINSSTRLNPNILHHYTYGSIICGILYGAQLTLTSSIWTSTSKAAFIEWCRLTGNTYHNATLDHFTGDFRYIKQYLVIICGILTNNTTLINSEIADFRIKINESIDTDGTIKDYVTRQGCGGCTVGCPQSGTAPKCPTGDQQYARNFCCGLSYNALGIRHIITIAELMRHRNTNLYTQSFTIVGGTVTIEKMLDFNAIFYDKPPSWYLDAAAVTRDYKYCTLAMKCFIGQNRDIFELGYSFFKKTSYKNAIIRWGRAGLFDERVMGYVTLTHGISF